MSSILFVVKYLAIKWKKKDIDYIYFMHYIIYNSYDGNTWLELWNVLAEYWLFNLKSYFCICWAHFFQTGSNFG